MSEVTKEFAHKSLRGPKGNFRNAIKAFTRVARKRFEDNPAAYEGLRFTRFELSNYASKDSAEETGRYAEKIAREGGEHLDWRVEHDAVMGRWYIWFRLDPEAR